MERKEHPFFDINSFFLKDRTEEIKDIGRLLGVELKNEDLRYSKKMRWIKRIVEKGEGEKMKFSRRGCLRNEVENSKSAHC